MIIHRTAARATALRFSLLASLGLLPLACGGTFQGSGDGGEGGDSGSGGSANKAGSSSKAGSTSKGGSSNVAGSTSTAGTGVGGGGHPGPSCEGKLDANSGLVVCGNGIRHRPQPVACGVNPAPGAAPAQGGASGIALPQQPRADGSVPCSDDPTKCSGYQYGYCDGVFLGGEAPAPTCKSGCVIDQECGPGAICVCGNAQSPTGGVCTQSSCTADTECGYGYCAAYTQSCGPGGFACHNPADECTVDAECMGGNCGYDGVLGHRACNYAVCGRPFLVEAQARLAPVITSHAWAAPTLAAPRLDHLTPAERTVLAQHWTRMGQMEHASIAAFARFSLQLLSLGAPPELVDACTQALADETAHTKLCFQLASAYAGHAIGPGRLDVDGSLGLSSLEDIVDLVIAEGCFGETGAALEALEAADTATDPVIRAAYALIARDEQRHAELAFQFVRWALERDPPTTRARLIAALDSDIAEQSPARSVVAPCFEALLSATSGYAPLDVSHDELRV